MVEEGEEEEEEEVVVDVDDVVDDASAATARVFTASSELATAPSSSALSAAWTDATETEEEAEEAEVVPSFIASFAFEAAAAFALADCPERSYLLRSSAPVAGSLGSALILATSSLDLDADCVDSAERIRCSPSPVAVAVRKSVGADAEKTRASCACGVPTTWYHSCWTESAAFEVPDSPPTPVGGS